MVHCTKNVDIRLEKALLSALYCIAITEFPVGLDPFNMKAGPPERPTRN